MRVTLPELGQLLGLDDHSIEAVTAAVKKLVAAHERRKPKSMWIPWHGAYSCGGAPDTADVDRVKLRNGTVCNDQDGLCTWFWDSDYAGPIDVVAWLPKE